MPQDIKVTGDGISSWDLAFVNNDLVIIDGSEQLVQRLRIKLKFFFAEWYLDTSVGIKYFESILVKNPDLNLIENILKATIIEEDEILGLETFQVDYDNRLRKLSVSFRANSVYGTIPVTEEFTI